MKDDIKHKIIAVSKDLRKHDIYLSMQAILEIFKKTYNEQDIRKVVQNMINSNEVLIRLDWTLDIR